MYARSGVHRPPSVRRSSKAELRLNLYVKPLYEEVTKLLYTTLLASAYTTGLRRVAGRNGGVEPEGTCLLVQKSLYLLYWYIHLVARQRAPACPCTVRFTRHCRCENEPTLRLCHVSDGAVSSAPQSRPAPGQPRTRHGRQAQPQAY